MTIQLIGTRKYDMLPVTIYENIEALGRAVGVILRQNGQARLYLDSDSAAKLDQ